MKETAKQILNEINSYSIEIRDSFKDMIEMKTEHIKSNSFLKRMEEYMKMDEKDFNFLVEWARNYK